MRGSLRIPVVRMGGGYLKAILQGREETVFGRDEDHLVGRLKSIGIRDAVFIGRRKKGR
jgi:hypothetical protein